MHRGTRMCVLKNWKDTKTKIQVKDRISEQVRSWKDAWRIFATAAKRRNSVPKEIRRETPGELMAPCNKLQPNRTETLTLPLPAGRFRALKRLFPVFSCLKIWEAGYCSRLYKGHWPLFGNGGCQGYEKIFWIDVAFPLFLDSACKQRTCGPWRLHLFVSLPFQKIEGMTLYPAVSN